MNNELDSSVPATDNIIFTALHYQTHMLLVCSTSA